jgi:hypothetical protein
VLESVKQVERLWILSRGQLILMPFCSFRQGPPGEKSVPFPSLDEMIAGDADLQKGEAPRPLKFRVSRMGPGRAGPQCSVAKALIGSVCARVEQAPGVMGAEEGDMEDDEEEDGEGLEVDPLSDTLQNVESRFDVLVSELLRAPEDLFLVIGE